MRTNPQQLLLRGRRCRVDRFPRLQHRRTVMQPIEILLIEHNESDAVQFQRTEEVESIQRSAHIQRFRTGTAVSPSAGELPGCSTTRSGGDGPHARRRRQARV